MSKMDKSLNAANKVSRLLKEACEAFDKMPYGQGSKIDRVSDGALSDMADTLHRAKAASKDLVMVTGELAAREAIL